MITNKNLEPRNTKGQAHGYWEVYWDNGRLCFKCIYNNSQGIGYEEWYDYYDCKLTKSYYI